jgi:hypothetical protein
MDPQTHLKQRYGQTLSFLKPVLSSRREGRVLQVLYVQVVGPHGPIKSRTQERAQHRAVEALKNPIFPGQPG